MNAQRWLCRSDWIRASCRKSNTRRKHMACSSLLGPSLGASMFVFAMLLEVGSGSSVHEARSEPHNTA